MSLRRLLTLAASCAAAAAVLDAAPAAALPGDPQIEAVSPADGAVVPASASGIAVVYTCPPYRSFESSSGAGTFPCEDSFTGSQYGADFSTSPELGSDGRLRSDQRYFEHTEPGGSSDDTTPAGQRRAVMLRNATTPGRYYWQARRICVDCPTGYETGPVRSFVVRTRATLNLTVQSRGYAGYPLALGVRTAGLDDETPVTIERRSGSRWIRVVATQVRRGRAGTLGLLPKGKQTVRVTARSGDQQFVSASRTVRIQTARRWGTARDAGSYAGSPEVRFRIARGGRELRDFRARVTTFCVTNTGIGSTTLKGIAVVRRARIAPDGRFYGFSSRQGSVATITGRVRGRRVTGTLELSIGQCVGDGAIAARRTG